MLHLAPRFAPAAVVAFALLGSPDSAEAKCTRAGGVPVLPGQVYVVDDRVIDVDPIAPLLEELDVLRVHVGCRDVTHPETGGPARQTTVEITTRAGAPALMESHLRDLVEAQRAHVSAHGRYAETLDELGFFATRSHLGIQMTVTDSGWSAAVESSELPLACHVAVGSAEPRHPDQTPGVPSCREAVDPEPPSRA